ncbi:CarD family transcriptional regulator [Helicovermis profundi]|uniref:CarD family transcriptional regulator n=1 Tax=Helicovermis profundi TaxID=3065157 RepID=A0AAU9E648_9FIRM|nr:CarD family transcriptional regulator [Clostridia bacterium S502]
MFKIGDKVVYPMHGAGIIESIEKKEILGEIKEYFILRLPLKNMKVMLPVDNIENIGLRPIIGESEVQSVLDLLLKEISDMPQNWNRRYRANMERVKSGNIFDVVEVVRDLLIMDNEKGLSTGERKMMTNSKQILISELVLASDYDEKELEKIIKSYLKR